jgi:DNA-binding cell septation regulator SpoVG
MSASRPAPIDVLPIRATDSSGTVKAYVDLKTDGITIKSAKIVQQQGQRTWLGRPGIKTNHGWQSVIEIHSHELRRHINDFVIAHWDNQGIKAPRRGEATWAATAASLASTTAIHRNPPQQDSREAAVNEWAGRWSGPDEEPGF